MAEDLDRRRQGQTEHHREEERDPERVADLVQTERAGPDRDDQERCRQNGNDHKPSARLPSSGEARRTRRPTDTTARISAAANASETTAKTVSTMAAASATASGLVGLPS